MDYITFLFLCALFALVAVGIYTGGVALAELEAIKRLSAATVEMRRENLIDAEAASRVAAAQRERDAVFNRLWSLPSYMRLDALRTVYVVRHSASDFSEVGIFVDLVKVARYVNADLDGTCVSGARVFRPDIWVWLWPWLRDYDELAHKSRNQGLPRNIHWFYEGADDCGKVAGNIVWGGAHSSDKNT